MLEIKLFGQFKVLVDGHEVSPSAWQRRHAAAIVKILALAPSHRMHRDQLIEFLWPEADPDQTANRLYQAMHAARRALNPNGQTTRILQTKGQMIEFDRSVDLVIDVEQFTTLAATAGTEMERLRFAVDLYTGDLLPDDLYEPWAHDRREELRAQFVSLMSRLASLLLDTGEQDSAITALRRLFASDPLHEPSHRALMRIYDGMGERQQAVRQFESLKNLLARDLSA